MNCWKVWISMLGLAALALPARATIAYYNGTAGNTQFTADIGTAGLIPSTSFTFSGVDLVSGGSEYDDPTTGVKFFAFASNGTTASTFAVNGTALGQPHGGDLIEITFPANVFAFSANLTFTSAPFAQVCIDVASSFSSSCPATNQNPIWVSGSEFVGAKSDTAFNTVWIGPSSGTPILNVLNLMDATGTSPSPEASSMLLMGAGLTLVGAWRWKKRGGERSG